MKPVKQGGICIVAGEASGDLQAALLIKSLKEEFKNKNIKNSFFWGSCGPNMRQEDVDEIIRVEDLAVLGITEIISHYSQISAAYKKLLNQIIVRKPDAVILVDYPGFNLRLLQDTYALGLTTIYHIPPKAWSHGAYRTEILKKYSHLVTSILPFETNFFNEHKVNAYFVGNPLKDNIDEYIFKNPIKKVPFKIGLLPGSRKSEINRLLPILIESFILIAKENESIIGAIPIAPTLDINFVKNVAYQTANLHNYSKEWIDKKIEFGLNNAYEVMSSSSYAWVCSGTATLETAFFNTPMSVIYKTSSISAFIIKKIIKVKYVSLVNLTANKEVVPEFLQEDAQPKNLVSHALKIFSDKQYTQGMVQEFESIKNQFPHNAGKNAAIAILKCIEKYNYPGVNKFALHKFQAKT
jgi:lipid-A-disaccharide synthase